MAGEDGRSLRSFQTVAVILVLCYLFPSLTCFSLQWQGERAQQDKVASEAAVAEVRIGSILFNGKFMKSESASDAASENGLLHVDSSQLDATEMAQLRDDAVNEIAWRRLNPTLHCGQTKMKFKAMGVGTTNLQLKMGNTHALPLSQVPETCRYSLQQNALGLVLVVSYDGCNVMQENGNYVLPMTWLGTPVTFICPISHPDLKSDSMSPESTPYPQHLYRHRRRANWLFYNYNPLYKAYLRYYMSLMRPKPTAPTTVKPTKTTTTIKPTIKKPQVYSLRYPYLYNPYYPYYFYYPLPNLPGKNPAHTTRPSTTATTTTPKMTTKTQKPSIPLYYPYFPYFPYPPIGQSGNPDVNYYHIIQHIYGKLQNPGQLMKTTQAPTVTTRPVNPTKPSSASTKSCPAMKTTTTTTTTTTTKKTTTTAKTTKKPVPNKTTSSNYPGPWSPYVPYQKLPFPPYVSYQLKKGKIPDYWKNMPRSGYKSGLQEPRYPLPGFNYWHPGQWFSHTGQSWV